MLKTFLALLIGIGVCDGIFNGKEAESNAYPWIAWLRRGSNRVQCGGALISERYVLTAAQCVNDGVNAVILGDHDRKEYSGYEQEIGIASYVTHPGYNRETLVNNLAIIELSSPADTSTYTVDVIPVLGPGGNVDKILAKNCRVMSWGYRKFSTGWAAAEILQELTMVRVNNSDCMRRGYAVHNDSLCLEPYRHEFSSLCVVDQGSPVVCPKQGSYVLAGVVSMALTDFLSQNGCSRGYNSAVSVPLFKEWIDSVIE